MTPKLTESCRRLILSRLSVWSDGLSSYDSYYAPSECPAGLVVIPGADVYRIDVSMGTNRASSTGGRIGLLAGLAAGIAIGVLEDDDSTGRRLLYGSALGVALGAVGFFAGEEIGSLFERECWRRIR